MTPNHILPQRFGWIVVLIASCFAVAIGTLGHDRPSLIAASSVAALVFLMFTFSNRIEPIFLTVLATAFLGYMLQGRGFAYTGLSPIFIGELVLFLGVLNIVVNHSKLSLNLIPIPLLLYMSLGLVRTVPMIRQFGIDSLRDAALWYYSIFAVFTVAFLTRDRLNRFLTIYAWLIPIAIVWFFAMSSVVPLVEDSLPHLPGSPLPIVSTMKPGDRAVILAGLAAFVVTGLYDHFAPKRRLAKPLFWTLWLACAGVVAIENRGGFVALSLVMIVLLLLRPTIEWVKLMAVLGILLAAVFLINPSIELDGSRAISANQLAANVQSIFSDESSNSGSVQDTKDWRLRWWSAIIDDTVTGSLAWQGWGFGPNLADEYGFQVDAESSLRSPHNSHITVLARMGVPGLAIWVTLQLAFAVQMIKGFSIARKTNRSADSAIFLWIIALWLASMINSMFDVYLESPQGAIMFWCVFGCGLFMLNDQRRTMRTLSS